MFDIAIIGFGATGVSLLKQIQNEVYTYNLKTNRVALFNPVLEFAQGKAFGDAAIVHKVNTPPSMLSLSSVEPLAFSDWMYAQGKSKEFYPNRFLYANFLKETYEKIKNSRLINIDEFRETVDLITPCAHGYQIYRKNGKSVIANKVVLCLGSLHGKNFQNIANKPGFFDHHKKISKIREGTILIAGTGLTAIDAFRSLNHSSTQVHFFSRHGFIPTCLSKENFYKPIIFNWTNLLKSKDTFFRLQHFLDMLQKECNLISDGGERIFAMNLLKKESLTAYFDYLTQRSQISNLPYQDILVSTRPYMHRLWYSMSIRDRIYFNSHYGADWAAWRHPVPYEVFSELTHAAKERRIFFHQVKKPVCWKKGIFTLETISGKIIKAQNLIDGTGGTNQLQAIDSLLLKHLQKNGLIEPHSCGGINIHPLTYQCQVNNKLVPGLYNIGPLNKGSLFSTNALWFNVNCTENWARQWAVEMLQNKHMGE